MECLSAASLHGRLLQKTANQLMYSLVFLSPNLVWIQLSFVVVVTMNLYVVCDDDNITSQQHVHILFTFSRTIALAFGRIYYPYLVQFLTNTCHVMPSLFEQLLLFCSLTKSQHHNQIQLSSECFLQSTTGLKILADNL